MGNLFRKKPSNVKRFLSSSPSHSSIVGILDLLFSYRIETKDSSPNERFVLNTTRQIVENVVPNRRGLPRPDEVSILQKGGYPCLPSPLPHPRSTSVVLHETTESPVLLCRIRSDTLYQWVSVESGDRGGVGKDLNPYYYFRGSYETGVTKTVVFKEKLQGMCSTLQPLDVPKSRTGVGEEDVSSTGMKCRLRFRLAPSSVSLRQTPHVLRRSKVYTRRNRVGLRVVHRISSFHRPFEGFRLGR